MTTEGRFGLQGGDMATHVWDPYCCCRSARLTRPYHACRLLTGLMQRAKVPSLFCEHFAQKAQEAQACSLVFFVPTLMELTSHVFCALLLFATLQGQLRSSCGALKL